MATSALSSTLTQTDVKSGQATQQTVSTNLPATESKFVNSEMLYFIQNKCRVLPFDSIVTICSDFYTTSEFEDARGIVAEH